MNKEDDPMDYELPAQTETERINMEVIQVNMKHPRDENQSQKNSISQPTHSQLVPPRLDLNKPPLGNIIIQYPTYQNMKINIPYNQSRNTMKATEVGHNIECGGYQFYINRTKEGERFQSREKSLPIPTHALTYPMIIQLHDEPIQKNELVQERKTLMYQVETPPESPREKMVIEGKGK